ncbi:MAG: hypothetical protein EXR77_13320 [Myxococcales bacterium]|nr:hypothetical protein [Myxococcales bacterium]
MSPTRTVEFRLLAIATGLCTLASAACDTEPVAVKPTSVTPPQCVDVKKFGNGAQCNANDPTVALCGTAARRVCASNWLCFDAPELVDCACQLAEDCKARTDYINEGRTAASKAPLASSCVGGRCGGRP